ncbi:hypothetical protein KW499_18415 [Vibrio fluvialis]|nr:hypothetical protein [Vibrio fluvialis]
MANYSSFERNIAKFLRSFPFLKNGLKYTYQVLNYYLYKNKYLEKSKFPIVDISPLSPESFYGYYDKSPKKNGYELFQVSENDTSKCPKFYTNKKKSISVVVKSINEGEIVFERNTSAFNWQQGSKLQWVSDDEIIFNDIVDDSVVSILYNLSTKKETIIEQSIYDAFNKEFFISIDYRVLEKLRPDYAYFRKHGWGHIKFDEQKIIYSEFGDNVRDIISIKKINQDFPLKFDCDFSKQKFNHIMISPEGKKFVFLHRAYNDAGARIDRFFVTNLDSMYSTKMISDSGMISHYNWIDENKVISYMNHMGVNGYYVIDLSNDIEIKKVNINGLDSYGDGHPTYIGDGKFITDTYPNKSKLKSLILVDLNEKKLEVIAEFFEPLKYGGQTRCDLHPKWDAETKSIYVESVHKGKRKLYRVGPINV